MPIKLYVDDIRSAPRGWTIARNYNSAIELLENGDVTYLSLDHDLGEEKTGYDIASWIERKVYMEGFIPPVIQIHSANPVGRKNIEAAIASIYREYRA